MLLETQLTQPERLQLLALHVPGQHEALNKALDAAREEGRLAEVHRVANEKHVRLYGRPLGDFDLPQPQPAYTGG
jgi:hypothetical protein